MSPTLANQQSRDLPQWAFLVAVFAVGAVQLALITTHDYFVDEWQALQIALQSPDLAALLANLRYEGHPPLWYLFLRGLAPIVGPDLTLAAATVVCSFATIAFIACCAPLPRWARLAMLLLEPILFEYGTISRGSSLGVSLTLAALAAWDRRRVFWILIALLPLVDFLFGVIALCLIALRRAERVRVWWPGAALFVLFAIVAAWSVVPAPDFISVYRTSAWSETLARWANEMAVLALPVQWQDGPRWDVPWVTPVTPLLGMLFLFIAYDQTRGRPMERAVALGFPALLLVFMLAVQILAIRHVLLASVVFLAVLWRQGAASLAIRRPSALWLVVGALCGIVTASFALLRPFDTAPEVARTIRTLKLENETWLSFPAQHAQGVSAMTAIPFEGVELGCRQDFIRWNFRHVLTDPVRLRGWLRKEATRGGTFYLLTQHRPAPGAPARELATIPAGLDGKVYHIYRVTGSRSGRRAIAPPCVAGNRPLPALMDH